MQSIRKVECGTRKCQSGPHILRGGGLGTIVDFTYPGAVLDRRSPWQVTKHYIRSNHQTICMEIKGESNSIPPAEVLEGDMFPAAFKTDTSLDGMVKVSQITQWLTETHNATITKKRPHSSRQLNSEISNLRVTCFWA